MVDARAGLEAVPQFYKKIGDIVPSGCYFKFHDIWRITTTKVREILGSNLSFEIFSREQKMIDVHLVLIPESSTIYSREPNTVLAL